MITKKEIVATIDNALGYFASLSPQQIETLNRNLALSNLGLFPTEKPFSEYLDTLVLELLVVRDDFQNRPVETHWDLGFVLRPIESAIQTMKEIIGKLSSAPHEMVFLDTHSALKQAVFPFSRSSGWNPLDPISISVQIGMDWTNEVHGDLKEAPPNSSNYLVMVNQYLHLLMALRKQYEFLLKLLDDDFLEIQKVVDWNNQFEEFQELDTELNQQLDTLNRIYFDFYPNLDESEFESIFSYFQDMFFDESFRYRFVDFFRDCEWTGILKDEQGNEVIGDYLDLSKGLREVKQLHQKYEVWREEFWSKH